MGRRSLLSLMMLSSFSLRQRAAGATAARLVLRSSPLKHQGTQAPQQAVAAVTAVVSRQPPQNFLAASLALARIQRTVVGALDSLASAVVANTAFAPISHHHTAHAPGAGFPPLALDSLAFDPRACRPSTPWLTSGRGAVDDQHSPLDVFDTSILNMAVPKRRTSHSKKRMRMSQKYLKNKTHFQVCSECGAVKQRHHLCLACVNRMQKSLKAKNQGNPTRNTEDVDLS